MYYQLKNDIFLKFAPGRWRLLNQSYIAYLSENHSNEKENQHTQKTLLPGDKFASTNGTKHWLVPASYSKRTQRSNITSARARTGESFAYWRWRCSSHSFCNLSIKTVSTLLPLLPYILTVYQTQDSSQGHWIETRREVTAKSWTERAGKSDWIPRDSDPGNHCSN